MRGARKISRIDLLRFRAVVARLHETPGDVPSELRTERVALHPRRDRPHKPEFLAAASMTRPGSRHRRHRIRARRAAAAPPLWPLSRLPRREARCALLRLSVAPARADASR